MAYGFLLVAFPETRQVYVNGQKNGPTNNPNVTAVGTRQTVTLDGDDYAPLSAQVDIAATETTNIVFTKRPAAPSADADT